MVDNIQMVASVDKKFLFTVSSSGMLSKLDISNGSFPILLSSSYLLGQAIDVAVSGKFVAVAVTHASFQLSIPLAIIVLFKYSI